MRVNRRVIIKNGSNNPLSISLFDILGGGGVESNGTVFKFFHDYSKIKKFSKFYYLVRTLSILAIMWHVFRFF